MNYQKIYDQIINRAILRRENHERIANPQKHHIIPRCMKGPDDFSNIAVLTLREHFICHMLLCKIYPKNRRLFFAFNFMHNVYKGQQKIKVTNRLYESLKLVANKEMSRFMKENSPTRGKPAYNRGKKASDETRRKISIATSGKNNGMYGRIQSEEGRARISEANRNRVWTQEMCAKMARKKEDNFWYGKQIPEEMKIKRRISLCYRIINRYSTNIIDLYYWDIFVQKTELDIQTVLKHFKTFENLIDSINKEYNQNYICKNSNPMLFKFITEQNTRVTDLFRNKYNVRILKRKLVSYYICFIKDHILEPILQENFCEFVNNYYKNIKNKYKDIKSLSFESIFKDYPILVENFCRQKELTKIQKILLNNSVDEFNSISLFSIIK